MGADTIMTTVLVIYLHRSRTGFRQYVDQLDTCPSISIYLIFPSTNSTIDALIAYTVTTGTYAMRLWTSTINLTLAAPPHT